MIARTRGDDSRVPGVTRDGRSLTAASLAVRSVALKALEEHRSLMERSRALVERSQALCSRVGGNIFVATVSTEGSTRRGRSPLGLACAQGGCRRAPAFHPCFAFGYGDGRITVTDLPFVVCAEHRSDWVALLRIPAILEALRHELWTRGRDAPGSMQVLFELIQVPGSPRASTAVVE